MEQELIRGSTDVLNCEFLSSSTMVLSTLSLDCFDRALSIIFLNFEPLGRIWTHNISGAKKIRQIIK
jgi:hypothetical protein